MVLYFREREAHDRTKQELAELRAERQKSDAQQAEIQQIFLEQMRLLRAEIRLLRSESHHHNGAGGDDATPTN